MPRLAARFIEGEKVKVSPAIYAALVDLLFQNSASMFLGTLCAGVAALMTAVKTGDPWLWPCAAFIVLAGIVRSVQMRKYDSRKASIGEAEARIWEVRYSIGSFLHAASLGVWCFVTLVGSNDPIAHLLCTASTIGYTAAGAGRNYGRPWIVQLHTVLACGPMALGLMLQGNRYYIGLGILLMLFYAGLRKINISLHDIFANLLISRERESNIARQFDTALNNMPHGLCMFGADGRVAVINDRFNDMMGIERDRELLGSSLRELLSAGVGTNTISGECADEIVSEVRRARAAEITTENAGAGADRALEWTFQPMHGGGTVMLVEDVTERRNAQARINRMARYDELTALPNRQSFRDEMAGYLAAGGKSAALLFIDLDQFKQVNDTLGHPAGDKLLCAVTARLREVLGPDDYVARFGGDEFVVFQRNVETREQSAELAARIVDRLSERYEIDHHLIEIGASIGIAVASSGVGADALLKHADMALYRAKADGRGTYCFFREEMAESVEARRTLEIDLRQALAKEEFELYFQPLVNLKSGRISTCEALLRWRHPTRGLVSPADIIPVAEEIGLIIDLGRWILRKACMECMTWPEQVRVAVNLSPLQFHQRNVLDDIRYALSVSGLPAKRLEIEITEFVVDAQHAMDARRARAVAQGGRQHLARRLRHRLFEPQLPAQLPAAQGEDRPLVPGRNP